MRHALAPARRLLARFLVRVLPRRTRRVLLTPPLFIADLAAEAFADGPQAMPCDVQQAIRGVAREAIAVVDNAFDALTTPGLRYLMRVTPGLLSPAAAIELAAAADHHAAATQDDEEDPDAHLWQTSWA